ncbi:MAG: helix-turn-helix transcriptional regulator [Nitrospinales bacterium]
MIKPIRSKKWVVAWSTLSPVTIWRGVRDGTFPAPVQLTANRIGWLDEDLEAWKKSRPVGNCELPANFQTEEETISVTEKHNEETKNPVPAGQSRAGQQKNKKL